MRVAIFEPEPRVCGPVNWAFHVREGFRRAGAHCDVVSFTLSGKVRKSWSVNRDAIAPPDWNDQTFKGWTHWNQPPDVVARWADAGAVLDGYDLVILTEPRHLTEDRKAAREDRTPRYLLALDATSTPWTTALHGPQYQEKLAPHLEEVFDRGKFIGWVTAPSFAYGATGAWAGLDRIPVVRIPLPYAARHRPDAMLPLDRSRPPRVGMTGRAVPNKGHHVLAHAAPLLPPGWVVELWGAASLGSGPNFAYTVYEHLVLRGWRGERNGKPETVVDGKLVGAEPGATRPASGVLAPYLWWLHHPHGARVEYLGGYADAVGVCERLAVHVDLTSSAFSSGLLEFVVLEAMDAGSVPVVPRHIQPEEDVDLYHLRVLPSLSEPPGMKRLLDAVEDACGPNRREIATQNRLALRAKHDPAQFAILLADYAFARRADRVVP